jgi:sulfur carrier protein
MIQVNGEPMAWHEVMTVRDVLIARKYVFPMLIITMNGTLVARKDYETTRVPDRANLQVVHLMSGG